MSNITEYNTIFNIMRQVTVIVPKYANIVDYCNTTVDTY